MSLKSNSHYVYEKPNKKLDEKYLYDIQKIEDNDHLIREVGKVDFNILKKNDLCYIFNVSQNLYNEADLYPNANYDDPYYFSYEDRIVFNNNVKCDDVIKTLKNILINCNDDETENLIHDILSEYIKEICYIDCNCNKYYYDNKNTHPTQDNIDHNQVGQYYVYFKKEFPRNLLVSLKNFLKYQICEKTNKKNKKIDNDYSKEM